MSSTVTYSRRKNSRSGLGKVLPLTLTGDRDATDPVARMPASYQRAERGLAGQLTLKHSDSVSEMASALLDTTLDDHSPPSHRASKASLRAISANDASSSVDRPGQRLSDVKNSQLSLAEPALRIPSLPRSHTSCDGVPLAKQARKPGSREVRPESLARLEGAGKGALPSSATIASDINTKIEAMLAATASLKAPNQSHAQEATQGPSMLARFKTHKIFTKVGHVVSHQVRDKWNGRLKESPLESYKRGSRLLPPSPVVPYSLSPVELPERPSPISTIELRLNEGGNLNKSKVQKITGGNITRKPLPNQASSLKLQVSLEDPFNQQLQASQPQSSSESRFTRSATDLGIHTPRTFGLDPFESENLMEDQDEPLLKDAPIGSSTPRRRNNTRTFQSPESPMTSRAGAEIKVEDESISDQTVLHQVLGGGNRNATSYLDDDSEEQSVGSDEVVGQSPALPSSSSTSSSSPWLLQKVHPSPTRKELRTFERHLNHQLRPGPQRDQQHLFPTPELSASRARNHMCEPSSPVKAKARDEIANFRRSLRPRLVRAETNSSVVPSGNSEDYDFFTKRHPSPSREDLEILEEKLDWCIVTGEEPEPAVKPRDTRPDPGVQPRDRRPEAANRDRRPVLASSSRGRTRSRLAEGHLRCVRGGEWTNSNALLRQDLQDELHDTVHVAPSRPRASQRQTLSEVAFHSGISPESSYENVMAKDELQDDGPNPSQGTGKH